MAKELVLKTSDGRESTGGSSPSASARLGWMAMSPRESAN